MKEIARSPTKATAQQHMQSDSRSSAGGEYDPNECAGCGDQLKEGQALIALERQWHIWCFRYFFVLDKNDNSNLQIYFDVLVDAKIVVLF